MNDIEWKEWAHKLDWLLDQADHIKDDMDELRGLVDGIQSTGQDAIDELDRFSGSGWTGHMGGDWLDALARLEKHLEGFDPKDFDAYLARRQEQHEKGG